MAKFSQVARGTLATTIVKLPLVNVRSENGERPSVEVGIRVTTGAEMAEILEHAANYARQKGSKEPKAGDPLYELGLRVHTIHIACFDPESTSPLSEGARFFASVDEILSSELIGRDGIWFLYEAIETWMDHVSPQPTKLAPNEYWETIKEIAESDDPLVCVRLRPALQGNLLVTTVKLLWPLLTRNSESGGGSEGSGPSTKKKRGKPRSVNGSRLHPYPMDKA